MIIEDLKALFHRDLIRLKNEIESYEDEQSLWTIQELIENSGGNLCLHLIGNLKTFIGNGLGGTKYVRKRDFEFSGKSIPRSEIYKEIEETIEIVASALNKVKAEQLADDFPIIIWKEKTKMGFTLLHLHSHLNYHLGQINYNRRILNTH